MAIEAGVNLPGKGHNNTSIGNIGTKTFAAKVAKFFGLYLFQLTLLQRANDREIIRNERQKAVRRILETFEVSDEG